MSDEEIQALAEKRVKKKKDFYSNLGAYIGVNILLIIIWALSGAGYPWFLWPLGIWGFFTLWSYVDLFILKKGIESEKAAIDKEVERIKKEEN
jgi:uncharacterized membrane protein YecN with MAPEG domain